MRRIKLWKVQLHIWLAGGTPLADWEKDVLLRKPYKGD